MFGCSRLILSGTMCLLVVTSPVAADDALQLAPRQGILVLESGEVLSGKISRSGDRYYVSLPHGELRVRYDDVEMVCRTLDEAYQKKCAGFEKGDVRRHVALGRWCLKHNLIGYAASELAQALAANPRHPDIPPLRRRLTLALEPPRETTTNTAAADSKVSHADLEKMMRELPAPARETFKQAVQPVLLNHCATSGCHGPRSKTALKLLRIPPGRTASLKLTRRNLHSVLQLIDRDAPRESRLLTAASTAHGGSPAPVFAGDSSLQYRRLVAWVDQLFGPRVATDTPEHVDRGSLALHQNDPSATVPTAQSPAGIDPFDPEVFNRRFFPPGEDE